MRIKSVNGDIAESAAIADLIERFLTDTPKYQWEWDDFISIPLKDPRLESVRLRCAGLPAEFPAVSANEYCGPAGIAVLNSIVKDLRRMPGA